MRSVLLTLAMTLLAHPLHAQSPSATLAWWSKVTAGTDHHAFTDLVHYRDHYYLCFRTGQGHVSMDGAVTILRSPDMRAWTHQKTIKTHGDDRDPHFAVSGDRLYVYFGVWDTIHSEGAKPPQRNKVRSHAVWTEDGETWSDVAGLYEPGWWLWRVRRLGDAFYSAAYTALRPVPDARETRLLRSEDGLNWELVSTVTRSHMCGEADFWKRPDGSLAMLSRTGGSEPARLFTSDAAHTTWNEAELSEMLHSPAVAFWKDRAFVAGRGQRDGKSVTKLWELRDNDLVELLVLPSGGDTGYPGLIPVPESLEEDAPRFYISWYSQVDVATGEKEPDHGAGVYVGEVRILDER